MHLPQTLITVMHRTGQQQTETEPKPPNYGTQSGAEWSPDGVLAVSRLD